MRAKLKILLLIFVIIVVSSACIEPQRPPGSNETPIATPKSTSSPTEQELPSYNETRSLIINDTFVTWSRGYYVSYYDRRPFFKIITNYSYWTTFLNEQKKEEPDKLEGTLFPGPTVMPKIIQFSDFNNYFIIVAMMGLKGFTEGPEIEIKNISKINNTVNIIVRLYEPTAGAATESSPYHIVIVKRELLPMENATFVFSDTNGNKLGSVEVKPIINLTYVPTSVKGNTNFTVRWEVSGETSINYNAVHGNYLNRPMKFSTDYSWEINYTVVHWGYKSGSANISDYPWVSKIQIGRTPQEFTADINAPAGGTLYIRVHTIVDGVHIYSPEYQIEII